RHPPPVHFVSPSTPDPGALHSFPTRRSSDLVTPTVLPVIGAITAFTLVTPIAQTGRNYAIGGALLGIGLILYLITYLYNGAVKRSEEHTSELQSRENLVCRLLLEKKKELESG